MSKKKYKNHPLNRIKKMIENPLIEDSLRLDCLLFIKKTLHNEWADSKNGLVEWGDEMRRLIDEGEK